MKKRTIEAKSLETKSLGDRILRRRVRYDYITGLEFDRRNHRLRLTLQGNDPHVVFMPLPVFGVCELISSLMFKIGDWDGRGGMIEAFRQALEGGKTLPIRVRIVQHKHETEQFMCLFLGHETKDCFVAVGRQDPDTRTMKRRADQERQKLISSFMSNTKTCATCKWRATATSDCHRFAPRITNELGRGVFPKVRDNYSCYAHEQKEVA